MSNILYKINIISRVDVNVYVLVSDGCVEGSRVAEKIILKPIVVSMPFFTMIKTPVSSNCSSLLTILTI